MSSAATVPSSLSCTIESITLGAQKLPTEKAKNFLVAKIEAFVQTEIFKNAVKDNPGTYRLRLHEGSIVLERQNGNTWERQDLTPTHVTATSTASGLTTPTSPQASPSENQELKTFTAAFRHFENAARFQESQRSAYAGNTCYLDAPLSLVRNIPSLYNTFLKDEAQTTEQTQKTKKLREASNGQDVRAALGIDNNDQEDAEVFYQKLGAGDQGKKLSSYKYKLTSSDDSEITSEKLNLIYDMYCNYIQSLSENTPQTSSLLDDTAAARSAFRDFFREQNMERTSTTAQESQNSSDGTMLYLRPNSQERAFQTLFDQQFKEESLNFFNTTYTVHKTLDYSQPLMINLGTHNHYRKGIKDSQPIAITEIPDTLENPEDPNATLHLQGFVAYSGNTSSGHWVAYFRKLSLDGSYKWYKDDDTADRIQEMDSKAMEKAKLTATYLYYDPDNYRDCFLA